MTYAEAQKMVEFEIDGRVTRVSIFDPLPLMSKEEFETKYGRSNDSVSIFIFLNTKLFFTSYYPIIYAVLLNTIVVD